MPDPEDEDEIIEVQAAPPTAERKKAISAYSEQEIIHALTVNQGSIATTIITLGVKEASLRKRIEDSRTLKAAWNLVKTKATDTDVPLGMTINEVEINTRSRHLEKLVRNPIFHGGQQETTGTPVGVLAEEVRRQDFEILNEGMAKAGIKDETIQKMRELSEINLNFGQFLVTSLDLSHRTMIFQSMQLVEESLYIKKTYLRDMELSEEDRQGWQRAFNEIQDLLGKTFDRTLVGTQAMVVLMGAGDAENSVTKQANGKSMRNKFQTSDQAPKPVKEA